MPRPKLSLQPLASRSVGIAFARSAFARAAAGSGGGLPRIRGEGWSCAAFCLFRGIQTRGRPENRAALERFAGSLPVSRVRTAVGVVPGLSLASWGNSGGFRGVEGLVSVGACAGSVAVWQDIEAR